MTRLFLNKIEKPNDEMLKLALGSSYEYCDDILNTLTNQYGIINPEWKYYGAKSGWTLKMMLKGRNLFFLGPCDGYFRIAFVFGDKAVKAIEHSDISPALIEEIKGAKRYREGRSLRIEVRSRDQIDDIIKLTAIKVSN